MKGAVFPVLFFYWLHTRWWIALVFLNGLDNGSDMDSDVSDDTILSLESVLS